MKFVIAGAGIRGKKLEKALSLYGIKVTAFIDNDKNKWGKMIQGIPCFPIDYFATQAKDCIVLISPVNASDLHMALLQYYENVLNPELTKALLNGSYIAGYDDFYPIGHYYSLYPNAAEVCELPDYASLDESGLMEIPGINLNYEVQREYLNSMVQLYPQILRWDCPDESSDNYRFRIDNPAFTGGDIVALYCMLNIIKPKRWIEVGSGWTSALTLDVNEFCFNNKMELTFIEPYADVLRKITKASDHINLIEKGLQDIEEDFFDQLGEGDVLFIDSTHVSKTHSDVNYLFFNILPRLKSGVIIHLHDIFFPFEYPNAWIKQGFVLNELFLLRSFLQYNNSFEIIYFQNMMEKIHRNEMESAWPFPGRSIHGGSFWMRKK